MYIAIYNVDDFFFSALTPRYMQWSKDLWLLDLRASESFLQHKVEQLGYTSMSSMLEIFFTQKDFCLYQKHSSRDIVGIKKDYLAVHSSSPWLAVLLLVQLKQKKYSGLIGDQSQLFQRVLKNYSWKCFISCCQMLSEHMTAGLKKRYSQKNKIDVKKVSSLIVSLGIHSPFHLSRLSGPVLKKRLGKWLSLGVQWMIGQPTDFPFVAYVAPPSICKETLLEDEVECWDQIEYLLERDLHDIADLLKNDKERWIVHMRWELFLESREGYRNQFIDRMQTCDQREGLDLILKLRKPCLLRYPNPDTAPFLAQLRLLFESAKDESRSNRVRGWSLEVVKRLERPLVQTGLFWSDADKKRQLLEGIENRVSVPIQRFYLCPDWLPERSYSLAPPIRPVNPSMLESANIRPFYIYDKPLAQGGFSSQCQLYFLERITDDSWGKGFLEERDYFMCIIPEENRSSPSKKLWVFKNQFEKWFLHGIFG